MPWSAIMIYAPVGGIHTPSKSPQLPAKPAEFATASIEAAKTDESIIRLHARDPETGKPDPRPETFNQFLPVAKQFAEAAVNSRRAADPA